MKNQGDPRISAFDAKTHLSRLLNEAEQGRSITITRRGKPVARLIPAHNSPRMDAAELISAFRTLRRTAGARLKVKQLINEGRKR